MHDRLLLPRMKRIWGQIRSDNIWSLQGSFKLSNAVRIWESKCVWYPDSSSALLARSHHGQMSPPCMWWVMNPACKLCHANALSHRAYLRMFSCFPAAAKDKNVTTLYELRCHLLNVSNWSCSCWFILCVWKSNLYCLVAPKLSRGIVTSLQDKSSFGIEWQVPQASQSRGVNLLRACKLWINIITLILSHSPPWRYDWRVRQSVRLLRACHKS